jgi:hypothetical protein
MLNSLVKSKQLLGEKPIDPHLGKIVFPEMEILTKKSFEELKNLKITKIEAHIDNIHTFGMTLSDGLACKAGTEYPNYNNCFYIDPTKPIAKIEMIMHTNDNLLGQINFFDKNGDYLYKMGNDAYATGRRETFLIADNERLIGCEIDYGAKYVSGITFIKWTIEA